MPNNVVSIPLGDDPVFNDDDDITRLAIETACRYCHAVYTGEYSTDRDFFIGYCHDRYYDLVNTSRFPIVVDEDGETWETTTVFFNVLTACYHMFVMALFSTMKEIHRTSVITGIHSVHLRRTPTLIADVVLNVRLLITGPDSKTYESYPDTSSRFNYPQRSAY